MDESLRELIQNAGMRVTATRLAVLDEVHKRPHVDADHVFEAVRTRLGSVSLQTIYNVLASFVAAGVVRRIEPAGAPALHEVRVGDNHHHLVCRQCGVVRDVDCAVGSAPCLTPSDIGGYLVDEAEVTYWGVCPRCRASRSANSQRSSAKRKGTRP